MTYPWAIGNFSTGLAKRQCYIAPFLMCLVFILQKHTYISVKEGIKYKRTFILWHVSLHMTGAFCKWVYIRKISQMSLLFHLYFLVGSGSRYWYDSNAFLFSLVNKPGWAPVKLPQTGKYSSRRKHSIYDYPSYGPAFGGGRDIHIPNYASSHRNSYSNLGFTYSPPSGYSYGNTFGKTFLAGIYQFTPGEIETFYETT